MEQGREDCLSVEMIFQAVCPRGGGTISAFARAIERSLERRMNPSSIFGTSLNIARATTSLLEWSKNKQRLNNFYNSNVLVHEIDNTRDLTGALGGLVSWED